MKNTAQLTQEAISLLKALIATPSFSSEEQQTALLIENWFRTNAIPFERENNNLTHKEVSSPTGARVPLRNYPSSLSDLGIVGCKSTAAGYFWLRRSARTPLSYPISRYWAAKSSKTSRRWGRFSLSTT